MTDFTKFTQAKSAAAPVIGAGSAVAMHYTIMLEDGTVADSTVGDEPLRFTVGDGALVEGLEQAILGLKAGDRRSLRLGPDEAFGPRDAQNIHWMPRAEFPEDMPLEPGAIIAFEMPDGDALPGAVLEITDDGVRVDFNHPLAGRTLGFEVEILAVEPVS